MPPSGSVSLVVPVHNGARCLAGVLAAIDQQVDGRWMEIMVDDASSDASVALAERAP